jgi:hypothetical protein
VPNRVAVHSKSGCKSGAINEAAVAHLSSSRNRGAISTSGPSENDRTISTFSCDIA